MFQKDDTCASICWAAHVFEPFMLCTLDEVAVAQSLAVSSIPGMMSCSKNKGIQLASCKHFRPAWNRARALYVCHSREAIRTKRPTPYRNLITI